MLMVSGALGSLGFIYLMKDSADFENPSRLGFVGFGGGGGVRGFIGFRVFGGLRIFLRDVGFGLCRV